MGVEEMLTYEEIMNTISASFSIDTNFLASVSDTLEPGSFYVRDENRKLVPVDEPKLGAPSRYVIKDKDDRVIFEQFFDENHNISMLRINLYDSVGMRQRFTYKDMRVQQEMFKDRDTDNPYVEIRDSSGQISRQPL